MIRISVIGAGRNRNGIGEYIAKYFHKNNARVVSLLGTTEESSARASVAVKKYGIDATPYTDLHGMVDKERPDAIVIASPPETHGEYLQKCGEVGVHVFCEKPFIWPPGEDSRKTVENILQGFRKKKLTVAMNSQWPFALSDYERICGKINLGKRNTFFVLLSPFCQGKEMIPDSVPHALSLLYVLFGPGEISHLMVDSNDPAAMTLRFQYLGQGKDCEVTLELSHHEQQPRPFRFGLNGRLIQRHLDPATYDFYFEHKGRRFRITDPLESSVRNFVEALEMSKEPLIGPPHIAATTSLLKGIYESCREI